MNDIYNYIIRFLLGDHISSDIVSKIGYTSNPDEFKNFKLVILKSNFFDEEIYGTELSLPQLPLQIWEETPILFGDPMTEFVEETKIIHADLVASTFFLISRYEEIVRRNVRDIHGRFPGKESLPYRAGFIDRPLVEEFGKLLRMQLREVCCNIEEPETRIQKIYLTHDVDQLAHFRNIRGMLGGFLRGIKRPKEGQKALKSYFGGLKYDPWYTFPWLFQQDKLVKSKIGDSRCESIVFMKSGGGKRKEDKPFTNLLTPDFQRFIKSCKRKGITLGLHSSYEAGITPALIKKEKKTLDKITKQDSNYHRNHFLDSREPEDMMQLINSGFTDDFTMSYADMAGFRLGTCRPVKWINPSTKEISNLILHSLAIMDVSLSDKRYMYMNAHDAYQYCLQLIDCVESFNGELVLLWHNTTVEKTPKSYHRKLYRDLLKYLQSK